jgi:hypothetical protein
MRKLARSGLVVALLGLPMGFATTGCSDNAGGNEDEAVNKTKGTVPADAPQTPEEYQARHKGTNVK